MRSRRDRRWAIRAVLVALAASSGACVLGYRAGGAVQVGTDRSFGANGLVEGYTGAKVGSSYDIETGIAADGGLRTSPQRGMLGFEGRLAFRALVSKVFLVTGPYAGVVGLFGSKDDFGPEGGLAFAVQPVVGIAKSGMADQVGVEIRAGIESLGTIPDLSLTGQFGLRLYFDSWLLIGEGEPPPEPTPTPVSPPQPDPPAVQPGPPAAAPRPGEPPPAAASDVPTGPIPERGIHAPDRSVGP